MEKFGLPSAVRFAPYNQVFQTLFDPKGLIANNLDGINLVLIRLEDWARYVEDTAQEPRCELLHRNANDLLDAIKATPGRNPAPIFIMFCKPSSTALEQPIY